ncbi:MAG: 4-hydroxythreonine-4-phosphate dehydrogenase PdxA [Nitrospirota bacterium]|jgi:4-hydroxythreonine-4-phosphate dehydrogenase|nr:4-hydroxythreonine-4-phosphate dehydrogenase PdxA [Nitrospirota bacterium]MDH5575158.1 4-hydroxythreonine-4-phosphate dehydrogenase PdxA [Nitrospirota bacterium]
MSSTQQTKPLLAITMGDPAGIGPEIIVKALQLPKVWRVCRPLVIGSRTILEFTAQGLGASLALVPVGGHESSSNPRIFRRGSLPVLDPFSGSIRPIRVGRVTARSGNMAVTCIQTAVRLAQAGCVQGIVTAPINKHAIHLAGHTYPGHTEMLADLTNAKESGMMIVGGPLKILFATTHLALREVPNVLTPTTILRAIRLAHEGLTRFFHIQKPRIGVAGLNPHAGENGLFGDEEARLIRPAIQQAHKQGMTCTGPHPADTLFGKAVRGSFDGIVALYHDQGLIPLKTVAFGHCVNITVGLPIIRTSVDHGTAYDIAGQGTADPTSLVEAIEMAAQLATHTT